MASVLLHLALSGPRRTALGSVGSRCTGTGDRKRRVDVPRRRRVAHALHAGDRNHGRQLRGSRSSLGVERGELRFEHITCDADHGGRQADHGHGIPPARRGSRSCDRPSPVEFHGAQYGSLGILHARRLRKGHRVRRDRRQGRRLHLDAWLLPARAGCGDRSPFGRLGQERADPRFPQVRQRGRA